MLEMKSKQVYTYSYYVQRKYIKLFQMKIYIHSHNHNVTPKVKHKLREKKMYIIVVCMPVSVKNKKSFINYTLRILKSYKVR